MPSLANPPFTGPFSHSFTSCVTSTTRNELAFPNAIPVANAVEAMAGAEEGLSVDSVQLPVTG
jgi:hypothetical protein